jgi:hypothetical protein
MFFLWTPCDKDLVGPPVMLHVVFSGKCLIADGAVDSFLTCVLLAMPCSMPEIVKVLEQECNTAYEQEHLFFLSILIKKRAKFEKCNLCIVKLIMSDF